jgi:translation initiation factor IF-2
MVVGFSVKCARPVMTQAARSGVNVYLEGVIYRLIEEVTNRVSAMLPPIVESRTLGEGAVSQLFDVKLKNGRSATVAGCRVNNGLFSKAEKIKVLRQGVEIFQGASRASAVYSALRSRQANSLLHLASPLRFRRHRLAQVHQGRRQRGPQGIRLRPATRGL